LSEEEEGDETTFYSAATSSTRTRRVAEEAEAVGVSGHFEELDEDPTYTPSPRNFASELESAARLSANDRAPQHVAPGVTGGGDEAERDLDVPAFMRRLQF
jgi:hypothetical protein